MSRTQKGLLVAGLVAAAAALCATVFVPALVFFPVTLLLLSVSPCVSACALTVSPKQESVCLIV